jgi:hypothetical protein
MIANPPVQTVRAVLVALAVTAFFAPAQAQTPSPNAIAMAKEIITVKNSAGSFNAVLPRVVERIKGMLLQTNPMLSKDLNDVSAKLQKDYSKAAGEPLTEAAKVYASKFTEQELRTILTFYKSPVGKKMIEQEPLAFQESVRNVDTWSEKLSEDILIKFRNEMRKKGHNL